ncbi:MAG TPA: MFS transporter, partial [Tepidisphaeraceae bacterium]|nr:MFS transporter [Tepidisphaeraceae bacterium]
VMLEPTIPLLLARQFDYGQREAGYFYFFVGATICVIQGTLIGPLTKRFGEWQLAFTGALLATLGMFGYAYVAYVPPEPSPGRIIFTSLLLILGLSALVNATGRSLQMPTMSAMLSQNSDPKSQGAAFGMFQGFASLARVLGPLLAGLLLQWFTRDWWVMFIVAAGWLGAACVLLLLLRPRLKPVSVPVPTDPAVAAAEGVA